jgi:uncharacterized protein (TIGR02217 family)
MSSFIESPRFPSNIAMGATGGPEFFTGVVPSRAGFEKRTQYLKYPRQRWDASPGVQTPAQFVELQRFFLIAGGRWRAWRFPSPVDFSAEHSGDERGIVQALTSTTFQAFKRYQIGGLTLDRKITKPVPGTFDVRVSGSPVTHTVNTTTGVITIATEPAAADVTWSGAFDVPMRFDFDRLQASMLARRDDGLIQQLGAFPLVEVPL